MRKYSTLLLLTLCFIVQNAAQQNEAANLILLNENSNAKCLDGSPAGYYYFEGTGDGKDKFVIYMQGGGSCTGNTIEGTLKACLQRSQTSLGSSKDWPKDAQDAGVFASQESNNPAYYNWHRIFINYCDGGLFQGSATVDYQDTTLYFRGYDIVVGIFDHLISTTKIQQSSVVVLSGGSAGGLGAFYWNQYLRNIINPSVLVIAAPDSGFFVDFPGNDQSQKYKVMDLITNGNRSVIQPQGCKYLYDNENIYKCTYPEYLIDLMPVPVFIINSLYDSYTIQYTLGVTCMTPTYGLVNCSQEDQDQVSLLHRLTLTQLQKVQQAKPAWGIWANSCLYHVYTQFTETYNGPNYEVPMNSGNTVSIVLNSFIEAQLRGQSQNNFYIDQVIYPNNTNCNGLPNNSSNKFLYKSD